MDARPWLEQLRSELARHKLPPLYAQRLMSELSDHLSDFLEDPMSMDATRDLRTAVAHHLGTPREVATSAAKEYRQAHFCGRHPILSFLVMPVVALPLLWAGAVVAFGVGAYLVSLALSGPAAEDLRWAGPVLPFVLSAMMLVPIGLAAAFFCRLGRKSGIGWKWPLAACVLLAVLSGPAMIDAAVRGSHPRGVLHGTKYHAAVPQSAGHRGFLSFGFGISKHPSYAQMMQFALPLAIGIFAVSRQANRPRTACTG